MRASTPSSVLVTPQRHVPLADRRRPGGTSLAHWEARKMALLQRRKLFIYLHVDAGDLVSLYWFRAMASSPRSWPAGSCSPQLDERRPASSRPSWAHYAPALVASATGAAARSFGCRGLQHCLAGPVYRSAPEHAKALSRRTIRVDRVSRRGLSWPDGQRFQRHRFDRQRVASGQRRAGRETISKGTRTTTLAQSPAVAAGSLTSCGSPILRSFSPTCAPLCAHPRV